MKKKVEVRVKPYSGFGAVLVAVVCTMAVLTAVLDIHVEVQHDEAAGAHS